MDENVEINETDGRKGPFEPMPVSIDRVWCKLMESRVDITTAQASYQSHQDTCIDCLQCQFFE